MDYMQIILTGSFIAEELGVSEPRLTSYEAYNDASDYLTVHMHFKSYLEGNEIIINYDNGADIYSSSLIPAKGTVAIRKYKLSEDLSGAKKMQKNPGV